MIFDSLKRKLPEYAKDLKLNLENLVAEPVLSDRQKAGAFIASALATRNAALSAEVMAEAGSILTPQEVTAAKTAAALMGMNNIYYRFSHLVSAPDYKQMPAKLRMNAIAKPGADKIDFELWSVAVSAINGCGACMDAHERTLRNHGVGAEAVQAAVRIGAVINAIAVTLDAERESVSAAA
jgi:alkyl hydroperoxide reductase subunit D